MAKGIVIILWSFEVLAWPLMGLGQGTIYTWVDSKGTVHYSDTLTGEARSVDDELPPTASFAAQPDTMSRSEIQPPALPTRRVTADAVANAAEREEMFNQWKRRGRR